MPEQKPIAMFSEEESQTRFSMSLDDVIESVNKAIRTKYKYKKRPADDYDSYPYVRRVWMDHAVFSMDGKDYSINWAWKDGNVELASEISEVIQAWLPKPAALVGFSEDKAVEREAKLFEAGDYPDKGVSVTEADLDTIIKNFDGKTEIKIEHRPCPFDGFLGKVKKVWRNGKSLMGSIAFDPDAFKLAKKAGANRLSVSIDNAKTVLTEVSLVTQPRVVDAAWFAGDRICFDAGDTSSLIGDEDVYDTFAALMGGKTPTTPQGGDKHMADDKKPAVDMSADLAAANQKIADLESERQKDRDRMAALEFTNREKDAKATVDTLSREGKITPAAVPFAVDILTHGSQSIDFADGKSTVGDLFGKFMAAQGKLIEFGEKVPGGKGEETVEFSDDVIAATIKLHPEFDREEAIEFLKIGNK